MATWWMENLVWDLEARRLAKAAAEARPAPPPPKNAGQAPNPKPKGPGAPPPWIQNRGGDRRGGNPGQRGGQGNRGGQAPALLPPPPPAAPAPPAQLALTDAPHWDDAQPKTAPAKRGGKRKNRSRNAAA